MHKIKDKFISSAMELKKIRTIAITAMFLALIMVLDLLNVRITLSQDMRITFDFLIMAMIGMMFGPSVGMLAGLASDVLGYLMNQGGGAYFPGFAITAALGGLIWGLFLYKTKLSWWKCLLAQAIINVFLNIGLNTLWLTMLYGVGTLGKLPLRILTNVVQLPIQVILVLTLGKILGEIYKRSISYGKSL